jgi:osmoprotectant transport system permease protein
MSFIGFAWNWLKSPAQWHGADGIPIRVVQHLGYTGLSLLAAALIALPLGALIGHHGRGGFLVVSMTNAWRAIPTLGLLVLMVILIGFSVLAWLVPLAVLAIPPILVNTYEGVAGVERDLKDAARGMGMTGSLDQDRDASRLATDHAGAANRSDIRGRHRDQRGRDRPGPLHH